MELGGGGAYDVSHNISGSDILTEAENKVTDKETRSNLEKERPPRWQEGKLFPFIEDCWNNSLAVVANYNIPAGRLTNIDALFNEVHGGLTPKSQQHLVPALLLLRSYGAFRAAAMIAICLPTDSFPLQRSCLEAAGYAQIMVSTKGLAERWLQRDDDPKVRNLFQTRAVREAIAAKDVKLADVYQGLYERTIDFGAHPNEKSVLLNIVKESVGTDTLRMKMLSGPGVELEHALRTCAQVGICSLKIFSLIFPEKFEPLRERIETAARPF